MPQAASRLSVSPDSVWYTRCPAPTPLSIAAQLGWVEQTFARHGIAVASIRDSRDPVVRQSHFDHHLDWSFRQGGNIPPTWARAGGARTRLVGLTRTDEFQAVIALPGAGIVAGHDLKGRRLGLPRRPGDRIDFQRATALKGIVSALEISEISVDDVELVDIEAATSALSTQAEAGPFALSRRLPYGEEIKALHRGSIDAFFVKGAEGVTVANLIGAQIVAETGFHPDARIRINNGTPRPLTVDATFATERPDLVADLIAAVQRVDEWAQANPADAVRFIAAEIGVSEAAVRAANGVEVHRHLSLTLDPVEIDAIAHFRDFLLQWGFITESFNVNDWVDPRPLALAHLRQPL
ncbi:ABC transporter substrate-binding protein [Rhizobium straminoryzae]|uniref:ABC transporter substrate-binding protein n=1 Tax=Rhizobium straminoryzae TaxID=1387186 RepID=A0A549T3I1_9HYPH|nr:ABC transporter substrate-binding protein [Rhizobium straminoryzae]TRL36448.1 ABC transporter substrate-binding protein [Rhizobium straminoryzae]